MVSNYDTCADISHPRDRILELLKPEDPGSETIEAIVRPAPRRSMLQLLDEDTRRFLQRTLQRIPSKSDNFLAQTTNLHEEETSNKPERSLADELKEAEECSDNVQRNIMREFNKVRDSIEREKMGKLALAVEDDCDSDSDRLTAAARRLDELLAESRNLHEELAEIQEDIKVLAWRFTRSDL